MYHGHVRPAPPRGRGHRPTSAPGMKSCQRPDMCVSLGTALACLSCCRSARAQCAVVLSLASGAVRLSCCGPIGRVLWCSHGFWLHRPPLSGALLLKFALHAPVQDCQGTPFACRPAAAAAAAASGCYSRTLRTQVVSSMSQTRLNSGQRDKAVPSAHARRARSTSPAAMRRQRGRGTQESCTELQARSGLG